MEVGDGRRRSQKRVNQMNNDIGVCILVFCKVSNFQFFPACARAGPGYGYFFSIVSTFSTHIITQNTCVVLAAYAPCSVCTALVF